MCLEEVSARLRAAVSCRGAVAAPLPPVRGRRRRHLRRGHHGGRRRAGDRSASRSGRGGTRRMKPGTADRIPVMKLLVASGAGDIGSVVTAQLPDAGHQVIVLDDLSAGHRDAVPPEATFVAPTTPASGRKEPSACRRSRSRSDAESPGQVPADVSNPMAGRGGGHPYSRLPGDCRQRHPCRSPAVSARDVAGAGRSRPADTVACADVLDRR